MTIYALDTNTVSFILKGNENVINRYKKETMEGNEIVVPPIVFYEIRRGLLAKDMFMRLRAFEDFCQAVDVGAFDIDVWLKAAEIFAFLKKSGKPVGDPDKDADILIAAYCLTNGYTLVTDNVNHFKRIDGLSYTNWKE